MKNLKSILCLVLALVLCLGLVACGEKQAEESKPAESKPAESKPAESEPADPLAEAVELTWVLSAPATNTVMEEVDAALKALVKDELNIDLTTKWIPVSDYTTQLGTIVSTGSGWDICCVDGSIFNANVARNAFLDLKPYLDAGKIPTASAELPEMALAAGAYNGGIYAISPTKDLGSLYNNIINVEMYEKYGIEIPEDRPTRRHLYGWMEEVNKAYRADPETAADAAPVFNINSLMDMDYLYDDIIYGSGAMGSIVCTNVVGLEEYGIGDKTSTSTAMCAVFTKEFEDFVLTRYDQTANGVVYGYPKQDGDPKWWKEGLHMMNYSQGLIDLDPDTYMSTGNFHSALYNCTEGLIFTGYLHAGMYAINGACKNPDRAVALVEMMYSNPDLHNLLSFGIEGADKDWTDVDNDGVVEFGARNQDPANRSWYFWYPFQNCAVMVGKAAPGSSSDFIEKMREQNNAMTVSQNVGFTVDTTNIQNEIAAVSNVYAEYNDRFRYPITNGDRDNCMKEIEACRAKLKANGIDKILAEVQAQLDAFHAGK